MSRTHRRPLWSLLLALILTLAACSPAAVPPAPTQAPPPPTAAPASATPAPTPVPAPTEVPTPEPLTITDGLGREITLPAVPQRIISLAPSNTELLFAVGAGGQMVGRDEVSDFPAEAANIASVGSTYGALNTEAIVALKPDLVLTAQINPREQVQTLQDLGLTVYWLANPTDFDGLYTNVEIVGRLTGHEAEAKALAASLKARVDAVAAKLAPASETPQVFYELDATDPTKPWTSGPGTFIDLLIRASGGSNVGASLSGDYAQISSEELLVQNPQIILLGDSAYGTTPETVAARPGWGEIAAVKSGAVYPFDDNLASRPGPRLVDGLEAMAKLVHPELFP